MNVTISHCGETATASEETWHTVADEMCARLGAWEPGKSTVTRERSTFERQVTDEATTTRIESTHDALREAGVNVDASRQLFATGTRLADSGYAKQAERAAEHEQKQPIREAVASLVDRIQAEKRRDRDMTAGELAAHLTINGALKVDGYTLREQAVRGVLARLKSPALSYVLGVRDRIADDKATDNQMQADTAALLDVMLRECRRFPDATLKLRMRDGLGDVFSIVSPSYGVADAPDVLPDVLRALPDSARASVAYDPATTSWEVRAAVFTPTPTDEQAVGKPFEGFVSFQSRDNGTRRFTGGGGILLIACLNASTYVADSVEVARVHRANILVDLSRVTEAASKAIHALCAAWGQARADVLTAPKLVPIEEAIPGFYRYMLTSRRGELVGVLPGRTETHAATLATVYQGERRDAQHITRSDLAQGWTRYIQTQPTPVRRDAEAAIGRWMVRREPVEHVAA